MQEDVLFPTEQHYHCLSSLCLSLPLVSIGLARQPAKGLQFWLWWQSEWSMACHRGTMWSHGTTHSTISLQHVGNQTPQEVNPVSSDFSFQLFEIQHLVCNISMFFARCLAGFPSHLIFSYITAKRLHNFFHINVFVSLTHWRLVRKTAKRCKVVRK